jgi:hypothetical protein
MATPKTRKRTTTAVALHLDDAQLARLDGHRATISQIAGVNITRTAIAEALLFQAIDHWEHVANKRKAG